MDFRLLLDRLWDKGWTFTYAPKLRGLLSGGDSYILTVQPIVPRPGDLSSQTRRVEAADFSQFLALTNELIDSLPKLKF